MNPTLDFLRQAEQRIRLTLESLRPKLLEAQGKIEHRLKEDLSVVTAMDTFVEEKLQEALNNFDSGIDFGGEEMGVDYSKQSFWLVDPIDGTEPFIRGIPVATNLITLIDNNEPVMGIIYNFTLGDYYLAIKGYGATCNGHPIHVSSRPPDRSWLTMSAASEEKSIRGLFDKLRDNFNAVGRYGAAGFEYTMIANGGLDGRVVFRGHGHEWDFAPTTLLVTEAGGMVANIGSDSYDYRNFDHVAANPVIFDKLMHIMNEVAGYA